MTQQQRYYYSLAFSPPRVGDTTTTRSSISFTLLHAKKHTQKTPAHHEKWQPYFDRLVKFGEEHGNYHVKDDNDLAEWLHDQRKQYHLLKHGKKTRLTKKRAMALERVGAIYDTDDDSN